VRARVGAEEEDKPDRWAPPVSARERTREGACGRFWARASGWPRRERERWAARGTGPRRRKREEGGSGQLGWLGCAGRRKRERKMKRGGGPAQERKRGREKKECNSNAFEFKFKI
jgi:hypothetical protein